MRIYSVWVAHLSTQPRKNDDMNLSNTTKVFWSLLLSFLLTNVPYVGAQAVAEGMISTSQVVSELSRQQAEDNVRSILAQTDVRSELQKYGISAEEASQRLAGLSDHELKQLEMQMQEARAGGYVVGILVIVVLVLLIIFLAKRV